MSVEATSWALNQQAVTDPAARSVLFGLANHANHEGRHAFPSVNLICRYTGLSPRTVKAKLKLLVECELIRRGNQGVAAAIIERSDRRPTVYDLDLSKGLQTEPIGDEERDATTAPRSAKQGAPDAPRQSNGVQMTTERGARAAPEPSLTVLDSLSGASESDSSAGANVFQRAAQSTDDGTPADAAVPRKAPMTLDWQPDADQLAAACFRIGLPADTVPAPHQLAKFTAHHADYPERQHGAGNWHAKLADWLRNDQRAALTAAPAAGGQHAQRSNARPAGAGFSDRDAVRQQLATPQDTSWADGLWDEAGDWAEPAAQAGDHGAGESDFHPAGSDFSQDVQQRIPHGGPVDVEPAGACAGVGALGHAAGAGHAGASHERPEARGQHLAADNSRAGGDAGPDGGGCGHA